MKVKDLVLISILSSLIAVLEFALAFIPNVQATFLLLILICNKFNFKKSLVLILVYVLIDNLLMSSLNPIFMIFQYIALLPIPVLLKLFKTSNVNKLSLISIPISFLYCFILIIPAVLITKVDLKVYILADIPFELILVFVNILMIEILYNPLDKVLTTLLNNYYKNS